MKTPAENDERYLERACRTWDWARAAGVSADELREALKDTRRPVVRVLPEEPRASDAA